MSGGCSVVLWYVRHRDVTGRGRMSCRVGSGVSSRVSLCPSSEASISLDSMLNMYKAPALSFDVIIQRPQQQHEPCRAREHCTLGARPTCWPHQFPCTDHLTYITTANTTTTALTPTRNSPSASRRWPASSQSRTGRCAGSQQQTSCAAPARARMEPRWRRQCARAAPYPLR